MQSRWTVVMDVSCLCGILPVLLVEMLLLEATWGLRPCVFSYRDGTTLDATWLLEHSAGKRIPDSLHPRHFHYEYLVDFCSGLTCGADVAGADSAGQTDAVVCRADVGGLPNVKLGDLHEYSSRPLQNDSYALEYFFSKGSRCVVLKILVVNESVDLSPPMVSFVEDYWLSHNGTSVHEYVFQIHAQLRDLKKTGGEASVTGLQLFLVVLLSIIGMVVVCGTCLVSMCLCYILNSLHRSHVPMKNVVTERSPFFQ